MSQVADNLFLGALRDLYPGSVEGQPPQQGVGPMGRIFLLDMVPLATAANNIALAQTAVNLVLTAGANVTQRVGANQVSTEIVLDVPRAITVTAVGANAATPTIRGFDQYGQPMTETLAAPATGAVTGKKAFKVVSSVTMSGTPGSNISVGTSAIFGLPFALRDKGYIAAATYNGAAVNLTTDVLVADGAAATASTGDVRGTVAAAAPDGVKRLIMFIGLPAIASGPNATRLGAVGVNQFAG